MSESSAQEQLNNVVGQFKDFAEVVTAIRKLSDTDSRKLLEACDTCIDFVNRFRLPETSAFTIRAILHDEFKREGRPL